MNDVFVDPRCGSTAGWSAHQAIDEKPCDPCKAARSQYLADRRARLRRVVAPPPLDGDVIGTEVLELTGTGCGPWARDAACLDKPADWFFPESPRDLTPEARALCGSCPVQPECLEHAVRIGEPYGIWGGKSEAQLQRLRQTLRRGAA